MKLKNIFGIRVKLIATVVFITCALTTIVTIYLTQVMREKLTAEYKSKGMALANGLAQNAQEILQNRDASAIQSYIDEYKNIPDVAYVYVSNEKGKILEHTFVPSFPNSLLQANLSSNNSQKNVSEITINGKRRLDINHPILAGVLGNVHIGMDLELLESDISNSVRKVSTIAVVFSVISCLLFYLVLRKTVNLIIYLSDISERITLGEEIEADTRMFTKDEVGLLAHSFKNMVTQVRFQKNNLENLVQARTRELQEAQKQSVLNAHQAGMSEIATGILHNVGNVLNSANVGLEVIIEKFNNSLVGNLHKANSLLVENRGRLVEFFTIDPRGNKLINFYVELGEAMKKELLAQKSEANDLMKKLQLIKDIINTQQTYAKGSGEFKESVELIEIVEHALVMQTTSLNRHEIKIVKKYSDAPPVLGQKTKLLHVVLNLIKNAKEAMGGKDYKVKVLTLETGSTASGEAFLSVRDSGEGIKKESLTKIFNHGFTTKQTGHGFGLHFCANAITEMGGKMSVASEGQNQGACFTVVFDKSKLIKNAA